MDTYHCQPQHNHWGTIMSSRFPTPADQILAGVSIHAFADSSGPYMTTVRHDGYYGTIVRYGDDTTTEDAYVIPATLPENAAILAELRQWRMTGEYAHVPLDQFGDETPELEAAIRAYIAAEFADDGPDMERLVMLTMSHGTILVSNH